MSEHHSIIIIGAGLSGLYCAWKLRSKQIDVILLEARERPGGRILSADYNQLDRLDLGPAWVWPQLQPRLQQLLQELNLDIFSQFISGDMLYEKNLNEVERFSGQSSHNQSYRITGGSQCLIDALQKKISATYIHTNTRVHAIDKAGVKIMTQRDGKPYEYTADKIILALPPRQALEHILIQPSLPEDTLTAWHNTHTWMSSHCKIVFIYDKPFWRNQNLSAEVFSHVGPLSEIYDGSPKSEEYYALTSFVGINAHQRKQAGEETLIKLCMTQLQRVFGDESQQVLDIKIKDWSQEQYTCTQLDLNMPIQHPQYSASLPRSFWNNRLILAGTEVAREHGGYLEGALESADEAISLCID